MAKEPEYAEVELEYIEESHNAAKFFTGRRILIPGSLKKQDEFVWLPKSQIRDYANIFEFVHSGELIEFEIEMWLAVEKGLV